MISLAKPSKSKKRKQTTTSATKPGRKKKSTVLSVKGLPDVVFSKLLTKLSRIFSRLALQIVLVTRVFPCLIIIQSSGETLVKYSALESCCCLLDLAHIVHLSPELLIMEYDEQGMPSLILGILFIGLAPLSKPVIDPVKMVKSYCDAFDSLLTSYMTLHPTDHDDFLLSLSPIRIDSCKARLEMIEERDINNILLELKNEEFDGELISERIVPGRQPSYSDTNESARGLKKLFSHQREALDLLDSDDRTKALVLHTSTSSGKSLVYQVFAFFINI
jgi:hypothetical protein